MHDNNHKKNAKANRRKAAAAAARRRSEQALAKTIAAANHDTENTGEEAATVNLPGTHTGQTETDVKMDSAKLERHVSFDMSHVDDEVPTTSKALTMQKQHDIEIENIMKLVRLGINSKSEAKQLSSDSDSDDMETTDSDGFWNKSYYSTPDIFEDVGGEAGVSVGAGSPSNKPESPQELRVKIDESLFEQPELSEIADELNRSSLRLPTNHSMQMNGKELADSFEQMNSMLLNFTDKYTRKGNVPMQRSPSRKRKHEREVHMSMPRVHRSRFEEFYEQRNKLKLKITGKRPLHIPGKHSSGSQRAFKLNDSSKDHKCATLTTQHSTETLKPCPRQSEAQTVHTCPENRYLHSILMSVAPLPNEIEQIATITAPTKRAIISSSEPQEMFESVAYAEAANVLRIAALIKEADELVCPNKQHTMQSAELIESSPQQGKLETVSKTMNCQSSAPQVETRIVIETDEKEFEPYEIETTSAKSQEILVPKSTTSALPKEHVFMTIAPLPAEVEHVVMAEEQLLCVAEVLSSKLTKSEPGVIDEIIKCDTPAAATNTADSTAQQPMNSNTNNVPNFKEILEPLHSSGTLVDDCFVRSYYRANDFVINIPPSGESQVTNTVPTPTPMPRQSQAPAQNQTMPTPTQPPSSTPIPNNPPKKPGTGFYHLEANETPLPLNSSCTQSTTFQTINIDATAAPIPRLPPLHQRMWRLLRNLFNGFCLCLQVNRDCIFCLGFFIAFVVSASFLTAFFYRTLSLTPHIYHRPNEINHMEAKPAKVYKFNRPADLHFQLQ